MQDNRVTTRPLVGKGPLRVLMVHWDGAGNLPPQRALARELARRGHAVHVLTHDTQASAVISDGGTFHRLTLAPQWDFAQPHMVEEEITAIVRDISGSPAFAQDFLAAVDALHPDVCLIDAMLLTTIQAAIEKRLCFAAVNHLAWNLDGVCAAFLGSIAATLPGAAAGSTFWDVLDDVPLVLATSYLDLGTTAFVAPHVHFVGPIREPVTLSSWPRRWPDRKLVLVSLSSGFQGQEATLRAICEALAPLPLEVVVTTGRGIAPDSLQASGGLEVRSFVPHDAVLPSADLVITHAGLGTLMYALGAGVPCLCLPNGRDQDDNAARVAALGLGRKLPPSATPNQIRSAVAAALEDNLMREATRSFAGRVARFGDLTRAANLVTALPSSTCVARNLPRTRMSARRAC
ncbi:glycosyltransferase [Gloeobacter kilaueensis]|uniref:Glycosyltransferase, MGT family n=1 Tax=Gloeobacter kilaueensis (strain ATCC BAA-2537 / CCAP 1431/1 / ULC 316 / JS1) TaxID=1183438 RepID=U5QDQ5_GLOK1|nr:nucleotide disphospho-sugar-binding domain-containing protein [Gloeobacter kilaueensis]AGY57041.1 glycosyltransferase, MGT family [Gloeobacter kilaueensis JS1]